jgi:hypothetical protein
MKNALWVLGLLVILILVFRHTSFPTMMFFAGFFWGVVVARLDDIFRWWEKHYGDGEKSGVREDTGDSNPY